MVAPEGTFPKIKGDILFPSEVNRFAGAGRFLDAGSTAFIPSGTGFTLAGSFVIDGGTIGNPGRINILYSTKATDSPNNAVQIEISGVSANLIVNVGNALDIGPIQGIVSAVIGSPFLSMMRLTGNGAPVTDTAAERLSMAISGNIDVSSNMVVKFYDKHSTTGSNQIWWFATSDGVGF